MSQLPSKAEIRAWIADNPERASKRDIAKAFGIKGASRIDLKRLLRELEDEGHLARRRRSYRDPDRLPPVSVLQVTDPDAAGDLFARPLEWEGQGPEPRVYLVLRDTDAALGPGDRILARVAEVRGEAHSHEGRLIRKIGLSPQKIVGIYRKGTEGGRIVPIDKKSDREWRVPEANRFGAQEGELVEAEAAGPKSRIGLPVARILERLGDPSAPKSVSLIAIHQHGIPVDFSQAALDEAEQAGPIVPDRRTDLTDLPFVTIDPEDARDHDDAVFAERDPDPKNPGGFIVWVAIADVAHYVRPGGALDREAWRRGNSTYFPDRVVPMLPERLSADLCSLHEDLDRPAVTCRMVLNAEGDKIAHGFQRVMIRSAGSLTYQDVEGARYGAGEGRAAELKGALEPLWAAWEAADQARARRQPLDLDLPERKIELSDTGQVTAVAFRERLASHRLIEAFMVLANVSAAETLGQKKIPLLYRVHEEPVPERLDALRETAEAAGFTLAKGQVLQTAHLNRLLEQAAGSGQSELISLATLRSMTQAYYAPENFGHFGLALRAYAHFTSPIRRYADLVVHRALISAYGWGEDGLSDEDRGRLDATAVHISETERRSMVAERDTNDRYLAAFLAEHVGETFSGRISGIARFGLFVRLDDTGADGLVPMSRLGSEYFHYDRESETLMGADTGHVLAVGQTATVRLAEAAPVTGGLLLELVEAGTLPRTVKPGGPTRRKVVRARAKAAKTKRRVVRRRK